MASAPKPATVEEYIASTREFARPICDRLRALIREAAPTLQESLKWNSPKYEGNRIVCGFGAFSKHVSLYIFEMEKLPAAAGLSDASKDGEGIATLKFSSVTDIPEATVQELVRQAVELDAKDIKRVRARRAPLPTPPALVRALEQSPRAKATFEKLVPSQQREYCEWISGAKQEATVQRRVAKAITLLEAGRGLNDQYR